MGHYPNGEISVAFEQTPVPFALHAIHANTGLQIVVPANDGPSCQPAYRRQPLEPAVRSLISNIGYQNFAIMYDPRAGRTRSGPRRTANRPINAPQSRCTVAPLTADEREKLQKDLDRWAELKQDERDRIEERLKNPAALLPKTATIWSKNTTGKFSAQTVRSVAADRRTKRSSFANRCSILPPSSLIPPYFPHNSLVAMRAPSAIA